MEEWGLGPGDLGAELVYVRISAFGQDGPYSQRPGLDRLGIAYGGLLHLTGERDRPPVRPGVTISDYLTGVFAAHGRGRRTLRADARHRRTGRGPARSSTPRSTARPPGARMDAGRLRPTRDGPDPRGQPAGQLGAARQLPRPRTAPTSASWPARMPTSAASAGPWDAPSSSRTRASRPSPARCRARARRSTTWWPPGRPDSARPRIEAACIAHDVPVGTAYTAADIFADPHMAARGDLVTVEDPVIGPLRQQAPFPRFVRPTGAGADRCARARRATTARSGATWSVSRPTSSTASAKPEWSEEEPGPVLARLGIAGEPEDALGDDVALHLAGAAGDGETAGGQKPQPPPRRTSVQVAPSGPSMASPSSCTRCSCSAPSSLRRLAPEPGSVPASDRSVERWVMSCSDWASISKRPSRSIIAVGRSSPSRSARRSRDSTPMPKVDPHDMYTRSLASVTLARPHPSLTSPITQSSGTNTVVEEDLVEHRRAGELAQGPDVQPV